MIGTPVVTAINGACAGIGFVLAACADIRIIGAGVRMGTPQSDGRLSPPPVHASTAHASVVDGLAARPPSPMPGFLSALAELLGIEPWPGTAMHRDILHRSMKQRNEELGKPAEQRDPARLLELTKRVLQLRIKEWEVGGMLLGVLAGWLATLHSVPPPPLVRAAWLVLSHCGHTCCRRLPQTRAYQFRSQAGVASASAFTASKYFACTAGITKRLTCKARARLTTASWSPWYSAASK